MKLSKMCLGDIIPCDYVEPRYATLFTDSNGRSALHIRVSLVSLLIKEKRKATDEETLEQIRENHYLQYFLGY